MKKTKPAKPKPTADPEKGRAKKATESSKPDLWPHRTANELGHVLWTNHYNVHLVHMVEIAQSEIGRLLHVESVYNNDIGPYPADES